MEKPTIFISHITEEKEIAKALKEFLEKKFLRTVNVFASSHEESIKLGDDWMNTIKKSMKDCQLLIMICSPISISSPWMNFEAGSGWVKDIPVIPLCHSGLTPGKLPVPINSFQGGLLNNQIDIKKLFNRIAEILNISVPDINDADFFDAVTSFESKIENSLLIKETTFIYNVLHRQIELLKYSIYASTLDLQTLINVKVNEENIGSYKFTFNNTFNLFNVSLYGIFSQKKVHDVYQETVHALLENIKFILTYNGINIPPKIRELFNSFIYSIVKIDDWVNRISMADKNTDIYKLAVEMIKNEPLPPTRKQSNLINEYIDYYESLLFYQNWLVQFESELISVLNLKK